MARREEWEQSGCKFRRLDNSFGLRGQLYGFAGLQRKGWAVVEAAISARPDGLCLSSFEKFGGREGGGEGEEGWLGGF